MAIAPLQLPSSAAFTPNVDFSPLSDLGKIYRENQQRQTLADLGRELASGNLTYDQAAGRALASGDRQSAMTLAQLGQNQVNNDWRRSEAERSQRNSDRSYDLQRQALTQRSESELERRARAAGLAPGSQEYRDFMLRGGRNADAPFSATDKKAIFEAEDAMPALKGTVESLDRALALNNQTFSGAGAGARAWAGSNLPDWLVPDFVADKKTADITTEWQKIMGPEALQNMANTLKGATTDFELRTFIEMLGNPSTPPKVRESIIGRMKKLAERKMQINEGRMRDLRGGAYFKPGGGQARPESNAGDPLAGAREAISRGADPEKVRQRLIENGIDPSGL